MKAPERLEGPRFNVRTWREGTSWFARVVPLRPEAAPFTDAQDARRAVSTCPDTPRVTLTGAVEAAISKWQALWGKGGA